VIVYDILHSNRLLLVSHILDHGKTKNISESVEKFTDWERFQQIASDLLSPRIEINSEEEADKVAPDFTTSITSIYRLPASKITLLGINNHDLPGLDRLLKHKQRLRKGGIQHVKCHSIGSRKPTEKGPAERHMNGGKRK
jgi:hypothetical protein